ncbi:hypothetical protein MMC07_000079 [Pseudocyphellaria aurata]|nr:hypothetical protein [Pseudocyphellaria aurata]
MATTADTASSTADDTVPERSQVMMESLPGQQQTSPHENDMATTADTASSTADHALLKQILQILVMIESRLGQQQTSPHENDMATTADTASSTTADTASSTADDTVPERSLVMIEPLPGQQQTSPHENDITTMADTASSTADDALPESRILSMETLPPDLLRVYNEGPAFLEILYKDHPWLIELASSSPNILRLQEEFLENSFDFMRILVNYLNKRKWHDYVHHSCNEDPKYGPVLFVMLWYVASRPVSVAPEGDTADATETPNQHLAALNDQLKESSLYKQLARSRNQSTRTSNNMGPPYHADHLRHAVCEQLDLEAEDSQGRIEFIENDIHMINTTTPDRVTFNYHLVKYILPEPGNLLHSQQWETIGSNLVELGKMVGANVPRQRNEIKRISIVKALWEAATNEGRNMNVMLGRMEKLNEEVRRQRQAITALEFRRCLEMVPPGNGTYTQNWKDFWVLAAKRAYDEINANPPPAKENQSPFTEMLRSQYKFAREDKLDWLTNQNEIGKRASGLYNCLIHWMPSY